MRPPKPCVPLRPAARAGPLNSPSQLISGLVAFAGSVWPPTPSNNEPQRSAVSMEVLRVNRPWLFPVQPQGKPVPAKCELDMRPPTRQQLRR